MKIRHISYLLGVALLIDISLPLLNLPLTNVNAVEPFRVFLELDQFFMDKAKRIAPLDRLHEGIQDQNPDLKTYDEVLNEVVRQFVFDQNCKIKRKVYT